MAHGNSTNIENSATRAKSGCVVSFLNDDGVPLTLHRVGPPRVALVDACDAATFYDPTNRVVCISTPQTIYTDLRGRGPRSGGRGANTSQLSHRPELHMLGNAGIGWMAHESLRGHRSHDD